MDFAVGADTHCQDPIGYKMFGRIVYTSGACLFLPTANRCPPRGDEGITSYSENACFLRECTLFFVGADAHIGPWLAVWVCPFSLTALSTYPTGR